MNTIPLLNPRLQRLFDCMPINAATVIIAGHTCLAAHKREPSCERSAEFMSFKAGVSLARRARDYRKPCHLVLWINDVGAYPETKRSDYVLPDNYSDVLSQAGLSRHDLTLMFKSSERTKALLVLRRFYKQNQYLFEKVNASEGGPVRCIRDTLCDHRSAGGKFASLLAGPDISGLVAKEGSEPEYHFILATFFENLRRRFSPGFQINIFNQVHVKRLPLCVQVSRTIYENQTPMANLFCDGDAESMDCSIDLPDLKDKTSCVMRSA